MSRAKYRPDISPQDVAEVVRDQFAATRYDAQVRIHFRPNTTDGAFAEVHLYALSALSDQPATVVVRGPLPIRRPDSVWSALMRLVWEAYGEVERNAWLWEETKRREARGGDL